MRLLGPNLLGYTVFLRSIGVLSDYLPDDSPWIEDTFVTARDTMNPDLFLASVHIATNALYNLAADRLFNFATDQSGQVFFKEKRSEFGLTERGFLPGVIAGAGDSGTSASLLNQEFMQHLTIGDLQTLKTPYGRAYLSLAQAYGPTPWVMV